VKIEPYSLGKEIQTSPSGRGKQAQLFVTVPLREDQPQHGHRFNDSPESAPR